jgi:sarcosine oxidase subunit alpha
VGFKMDDSSRTPEDGAIIVDDKIRGYVCTARYSTTLKASIGMALVESRLSAPGTSLKIFEGAAGGRRGSARVATMPFYDPEGRRMRG